MKHLTFTLSAALATFVLLSACKPSAQQQQQGTQQSTTRDADEPTDSAQTATPEYLTLTKAFDLVAPGQKLEPAAIEQLFASMQLPMQLQEQYISDADWGGDSPAINYCFGNNVMYENYQFSATDEDYYGVHTNFFFDDSRQTGTVSRFTIITSDSLWHARLMEDAATAGLKFEENVDPNVYGKKGKLYQKSAGKVEGSSENATYYIFDFSMPGHFDVEVGYDSGLDI